MYEGMQPALDRVGAPGGPFAPTTTKADSNDTVGFAAPAPTISSADYNRGYGKFARMEQGYLTPQGLSFWG
jgi:hypothetical protein